MSVRADGAAVVTGGASGIGRATAVALARAGVGTVVVISSRPAEDARQAVDAIRAAGAAGAAISADLADPEQARAAVARVLEEFGDIAYLVSSAATTRAIPFADLGAVSAQDWQDMLALNTIAPFTIVAAASESLRRTRGAVVNIATASAERGTGTSIPYSVSKAALVQLTRCLSVALAPDVRVNTVSPGAVRSEWMPRVLGEAAAAAQHERERERIPLKRIAEPEDIAEVVVATLLSEYLSGQNIVVDGGRSVLY